MEEVEEAINIVWLLDSWPVLIINQTTTLKPLRLIHSYCIEHHASAFILERLIRPSILMCLPQEVKDEVRIEDVSLKKPHQTYKELFPLINIGLVWLF